MTDSSKSIRPGAIQPVINRNRCEGKGDCATVCPYDVFTIGTLPPEDRKGLNIIGKVKGFVHGWQQALVTNIDACHGCGICVTQCPEDAITLTRES